jgi:hypothetical protein
MNCSLTAPQADHKVTDFSGEDQNSTRTINRSLIVHPHGRIARTAVAADNPESPALGTGEIKTRSASALLEQYEACFGQHPLLPGGQAAAGFPLRQVADYLNDLDQIP